MSEFSHNGNKTEQSQKITTTKNENIHHEDIIYNLGGMRGCHGNGSYGN